jgi:hypothetical protein
MNVNINPISGFVSKVKGKIAKRKKAQENFRNRKDNTNYYRDSDYWADNTN